MNVVADSSMALNFSHPLVPPRANISMETVAVQGNPLMLSCNPTGQPAPSITWFRGPAQIQDDARIAVDSLGRLLFSIVFSTDAGSYRCIVSNEVGTDSATTELRVLGKSELLH